VGPREEVGPRQRAEMREEVGASHHQDGEGGCSCLGLPTGEGVLHQARGAQEVQGRQAGPEACHQARGAQEVQGRQAAACHWDFHPWEVHHRAYRRRTPPRI